MKNIKINLILILTLFLGSQCAGEKEPDKKCLPCADLIITNSSEYTIIELYAHSSIDYYSDTTKVLIAQNMLNGDSLVYPVNYQDKIYFTFIRRYFSSSNVNIAITTNNPVYIQDCYKFSLFLLEEDFYLRKEDNFTY